MPGSPLWGWLGPLGVTLFGAILRFTDLGRPHAVMFDETYYAKGGWALVNFGVERKTLGSNQDPIADRAILKGDLNIWERCTPPEASPCPDYVAHPPLGKWMIGAGEWLFGMNPFGWRFVAALVGVLSILILARVARRMTRSTVLGCLAGLLLALDGLHFVLSRSALLDVFLMFWVLAGFACLVADREAARARLVAWYESSPLSAEGPRLGGRPWRLAAGVCLGAACAVKWSAIFFLIAFAVMSLLWDAGARRAVGVRRPYVGALRRDLPGVFPAMALIPAGVYLVSWTGWFVSSLGYGRNWEQATSQGPYYFVFDSVRSLIEYHRQVLGFHTGLQTGHDYMSEPWEWPLLLRPVAFFYKGSSKACGADSCSQAIHGVGTQVIWYGALAALVGLIAWYVATRDWRAGAVLIAYAAGWLPWFYYALADNRTMYLFYMAPLIPFMVLALVLVAGLILGPADATARRRAVGAAAVGAFALLALANFAWLHPVLVGDLLTYQEWRSRMMLPSWIGR
ncbi:phospholipid carrier-dependent glycosyltransferase [Spongiactinospora sp. TRM90649]|uniref:dolichyl-phosphate-mannose--protein mannosyltransferase n=1 Tax=Spongiactinospora sp. TRM90649 TaxID=3031114 RepID=UPI0023F8C80A|nr:phospholipid carrier-dependent glycosyltransferase [Spongiactinospora sp. TRM90649]MDF5757705.1 phospholipid carrier-dependent glycosyltransferase [Spongiactinospora sp. TRM90649]